MQKWCSFTRAIPSHIRISKMKSHHWRSVAVECVGAAAHICQPGNMRAWNVRPLDDSQKQIQSLLRFAQSMNTLINTHPPFQYAPSNAAHFPSCQYSHTNPSAARKPAAAPQRSSITLIGSDHRSIAPSPAFSHQGPHAVHHNHTDEYLTQHLNSFPSLPTLYFCLFFGGVCCCCIFLVR